MDGSVLEEKSSFKMLGLIFSSKLDWGSYIISIAKSASKKIGALICSVLWSFFLLRLLSISINLPYGYAWNTVVMFGLVLLVATWNELLDKLQKRICRTVGPSLAASLEPLAHRRNVASLNLFIGITLVDIHLNWLNWFHFLILVGGLLVILRDCMIFFCHHS